MSELSLQQAQAIIASVIAHGRDKKLNRLAVAVLDARGALKAFAAEDGSSLKRAEIAIGKAAASLALGVGSRSINKMAKERPWFIGALSHSVSGPFIPVPGGVLMKDAAGAVIGAVGVSGDSSDNDEAAASAAIAATGFTPDGGSD